MSKVDLRIVTLTVPPQEVITWDNVTIKVTAVLYFYVKDPIAAVVKVVNFNQATTQIGQTTLRNVPGQSELDELLAERKKINRDLQVIIDEQTEHWGVQVTAVVTRTPLIETEGRSNLVDCSSCFTKKGYTYVNVSTNDNSAGWHERSRTQ